jgi:tetratricopeptide (TPR) repeat protein
MKWRPPVFVVTVVLCAISTYTPFWSGSIVYGQTSKDLRQRALELAYNLDHDQALELLRRAVALSPDDPAPHRSLASVLWLNLLFRRGAVTVDHYLGSLSRSSVDLAKPPPDIDREFRFHVERAISLAERRVASSPGSAQAHYDLGAAVGLQASYIATVEGRMLAGFRAAQRCYDEHEKVLALDPSRKDAGLIVGTYRYVVSTMALPMRMMAYVAGFGGGRERGIQMLEETAEFNTQKAGGLDTKAKAGGLDTEAKAEVGNDSRTDALFALVLVYNRERRFDDALRVLQELRRLYPRNRLLLLEAGATALRGGRAQQADDLLTEGLAMLAKDQRARIPGEEALWRYKRGTARASLGRAEAAFADLQSASSADAQAWVHGRARVELGRLALKRGDRGAAAVEARQAETLCVRGNDPVCIQDARSLLRSSNGR